MKTVIQLLVFLFVFTGANAQTKNLETKSVTLNNLISFIAESFPLDAENEDDGLDYNLTFLVESSKRNFSREDETILKQAFKFLSNRLTEIDVISIIVYSGQNGLLINNESPKSIKKIFHALSNLNDSIIEDYNDGIGEAYTYANNNLDEDANNTLIMVRNPNAEQSSILDDDLVQNITPKEVKNNTGNIVLLTAISLLPELIQVIKK